MTSHPRTFDPSNGSARDLSTLFRCCSAGDARTRERSVLYGLPAPALSFPQVAARTKPW